MTRGVGISIVVIGFVNMYLADENRLIIDGKWKLQAEKLVSNEALCFVCHRFQRGLIKMRYGSYK